MKTPPLRIFSALEKTKVVYKLWVPIHRKIPRTEKLGIGLRIDNALLNLLSIVRKTGFASGMRKIELLTEAIGIIDDIRFFFQMLWEIQIISDEQFTSFGQKIEEIGREIGGWRRGLLAKTPPLENGGEKR